MKRQNNPLDVQIGGSHYKGFVIQPVEFSYRNGLGFLEGCIIKRTCRFDQPTGKGIEDLKKIKHEIELLIHFVESGTTEKPQRIQITVDEFAEANHLDSAKRAMVDLIARYTHVNGVNDLYIARELSEAFIESYAGKNDE